MPELKGLMQLMTYTAKLVSKQAKLPWISTSLRLTSNPEYNINLRILLFCYFAFTEFEGAYPFAIAGYNAGPKRVKILE